MKQVSVLIIMFLVFCSFGFAAFEDTATEPTTATQTVEPAPAEEPAPATETVQPAPAEEPAPETPPAEEKPLDIKTLKFSREIGQFDYNSSDITTPKVSASLKSAIAKIGEKIKMIPEGYQIEVIGHADASGPEEPTGDKRGNIALSESRAQAVVDYIVAELGVPSTKFKVIGKGSKELKDSKHPKSSINRRVVIRFLP